MDAPLKSNRLVFAGPFLGEFGWELSHWAPHVRWLRKHYPSHWLIVASYPGRHPIYYGVANEFWPLPKWFLDEKYDIDCFEALAPENVYGRLLKHFQERCESDGSFSDITYTRTPRGFNHGLREFKRVDFGELIPSERAAKACNKLMQEYGNKPCVLIFARSVNRKMFLDIKRNQPVHIDMIPGGLPTRNWPRSHWEDLFDMLYDKYKDKVTFVVGGTKAGNCLIEKTYQYTDVINLAEIDISESLDITIAFLRRALCSISSQSGPTHLSLQAKCPSFIYGHEYERHAIADNPFKTDVVFFGTKMGLYNDPPELLFNDSDVYIEELLKEKAVKEQPKKTIELPRKLFEDCGLENDFINAKGDIFKYSPDTYSENLDEWIKTSNSSEIFLKKYSEPWFQSYINRWKNWFNGIDLHGRILELGFQDGKTLYQIGKKYKDITIDALDFNPGLNRIIPHLKNIIPNLEDIWIGDCQDINKPDEYYNFISCLDFYEHLPRNIYLNSIKESYRILKNDGKIFVYVGKTDAAAHINLIPDSVVIKDMENAGFIHLDTIADMMTFSKLKDIPRKLYEEPIKSADIKSFGTPIDRVFSKKDIKEIKSIGMIGVFDVEGSTNIPFADAFENNSLWKYNYRTELQNKGALTRNQEIIEMAKRQDLMIFCKGNGILPEVYRECTKHCITCWIMMDSVDHLSNRDFLDYAQICDFSVVTTMAMKDALESAGIRKPIYHMIQPISPDEFYPVEAEKKYDVVFIGTKSEKRDKILDAIREWGYSVKTYGHGYGEYVTGEAFNRACCEGLICLAINNTDGMIDSFSDRILRYMATKSFVLTEYSYGLEKYFTDNEDLFWFKDLDELKFRLRSLEVFSNLRNEIAESGYSKVLKNHTWKIFAEQVLKIANKEFGNG